MEYWNDPDLEVVRQLLNPLQMRLAKIDDGERKRAGIAKLQRTLQALEF